MAYKINKKQTGYTRSYSAPLGVDRDGDGSNISPRRLARCENMYRDYGGEGGGVIESIPGFRKIASLGKRINGIFNHKCLGKEYLLLHAGDTLYRTEISESFADPEPVGTLTDAKSQGFSEGECFYILDTSAIYKLGGGTALEKIERGSKDIYVPTTYLDGVEYESRNLLTEAFREEFTLTDPWDFSFGTADVNYVITDPVARYCAVSGVFEGFGGQLYIPRYVKIGEVKYRVKEILSGALDGESGIYSVRIADGVEKIGEYAFRGCRGLTSVTIPDSVTEIGNGAFSGCTALLTFYLGAGLTSAGTLVLENTPRLTELNYALDENRFKLIENYGSLAQKNINYKACDRGIMLHLPVYSHAYDLTRATLDGEEIYLDPIYEKEIATGAMVFIEDYRHAFDKPVILEGNFNESSVEFNRKSTSFLDTGMGKAIGGFDAVTKCTVVERFDGRVFFAGNPDLQNAVFYSERDLGGENNPLYIGVHNYFLDGTGYYATKSMLAVRDSLAVFKSGDDGEGSIFYHKATDTQEGAITRIYPRSYVHSGTVAKGDSVSFLDDPVFISPLGLSALKEANISYERSVEVRSHNVNRDLLCEDLDGASLTVWCGYLVLGVVGKIYLADSRATFRHETGNYEYEWFILSDIGTYPGDEVLFRYSSTAPEGYDLSSTPDKEAHATVYSESNGTEIVYFVYKGDKKLAVYKTEERYGGDFSPAIIYHAVGDRLFFGTECGDVCVFNNDMRGKAPESITGTPDFDPAEYARDFGQTIHGSFYSFAGHAPRYVLQTARDSCGIPHLEKSTVKGSLAVKCRGKSRAKIHLEVGTDKRGYSELAQFSAGDIDFGELDFSVLTLDGVATDTLSFREKEKRWVEKQITLYSDTFCAPIGIYSISYRYTVDGSIKQR